MLRLNLQIFLRDTPIVFHLEERSIVKLEGMLEYIIVATDSWEYPTDFLVLQPNSQSNRYCIILGRPWMARTNA